MRPIRILSALILILAMAGSSCDKFNLNTDDLDITLDMSVIKTFVNLQFKDAATGDLIGFDDYRQVEVTVFGPDSQWVVNTSGYRTNQFFSTAGFMTAGLDPYNAIPSAENPVELTFVARLEGFLPTSIPIRLIYEGDHDFIINMVYLEAPPSGVLVERHEDVGNSSGGTLNEEINLITSKNEVSLRLPEGTEIRDKLGNPLQGKLDVSVAYFNPTKSDALACFPGGLSVEVNSQDGDKAEGAFFSAGFVAIDLTDESGKEAATFTGKNLELDMAIDEGIINYETGEPVKAGDMVPIWSYNEETGDWTFEKYTYITASPTGLRATANMPHLSYWNFDWFTTACAMLELYFTTQDPDKAEQWGYNLMMNAVISSMENDFQMRGLSSGFPAISGAKTATNTEVFQGVPLYREITITFENQTGTTPLWLAPAPVTFTLTGNSMIEVPLTPNPDATGTGGSQTQTITFNVTIYCTDQGINALIPNGTILRYRIVGTAEWSTVTATGGTVVVAGLQPGKMYETQALYNGQWEPSPAYTYWVEQSAETILTRNLRFEIVCGQ